MFAVALAAAAIAACSDSTRPDANGLTGRYELTSLDGAALPRLINGGIDGSTFWLVGGTLDFRTRGRVLDIRTFQYQSPSRGIGPLEPDTAAFAYDLVGDTVLVRHPAALAADSYTDTGTVVDNGNVLTIVARSRLSQVPSASAMVGGEMRYTRAP